jgi:hypothetical protein
MANTQGSVVITPDSLNKSFVKYRQDLLVMPMFGLNRILPYITLHNDVRYKEVVGQLSGDMQLQPYDPLARDDNDVNIAGRELETFLGSAVKGFDPNSTVQSIYGSNIVQGDGLKGVPVTKAVWTFLMGKLGEHLYDNLFTAKRDAAGKTTATLFNGFKTIADAEITANTISTANGNYLAIDAFTANNAEDMVNNIFDAADEKLTDQNTIMLMNNKNKLLYERDYQTTHGALPYNTEFKKTYVEGSDNKCEMVGVGCIPKDFILVTTKQNLIAGIATAGPQCNFECKDSLKSHFLIDFVATMFFGCQYETISKERLLVAKVPA